MQLLWIILRYLFPRDPLRQGAEVLRHRMEQLEHIANDAAQLGQLLIDPALRRHLEFILLDAEDCLRLWIAMRGCQIAKVRPRAPRRRATPHVTHARSLPELLLRIATFAAMVRDREKLAQSHAAKLKQLREADPLAAHGSPNAGNGAARYAAAHHKAVGVAQSRSGLMVSSGAVRSTSPRPSNHEAVLTALAAMRGPPHSIAAATP